ncbi:MAG: cation transporter [Hyphomicrobiaceae bacterium]|nr:cation transporter [Hyphomicrobiaceae bacterium]
MQPEADRRAQRSAIRRTVLLVALLNLSYFGVEAAVAALIRSVSLFADSIDFLEDAAVNMLVLMAIGWSAMRRRFVGIGLAVLLVMPGIAALATAGAKILSSDAVVPEPLLLTATGAGALVVNGLCALLLVRVRHHGGSLTRAAYLSARNDVAANIAIIVAGGATAVTSSVWPDIIVGLAIAAINMDAAREIYQAAMDETDDDRSEPGDGAEGVGGARSAPDIDRMRP